MLEAGFSLWPIFSRIKTESMILSLFQENAGHRKPLVRYILRSVYN